MLFIIKPVQQIMQRLRARSHAKLYQKELLPTLKLNSSSFVARNIIPISKFDLDSNFVLKEQRKFKLMSTIQPTMIKQRSISRTKKSIVDSFLPLQNTTKLFSSDSKRDVRNQHHQQRLDKLTSKNIISIQLSKTSSKNYGLIKAYAANSHPGVTNATNQDRICIVTNLNKTNIKTKQVSFFSIYDGSQNIHKADYYRDNFHLILNSNQDLIQQPQKAIKSTIEKIEKSFSNNMAYNGTFQQHSGKVGYAIIVFIGQSAYAVVSGPAHLIISRSHGLFTEKLHIKHTNNDHHIIAHNKLHIKQHLKKSLHYNNKRLQSINIIVQKIPLNQTDDEIDFIILGSEGLCEKIKQEELVKRLWSYIIKSKHQNIHTVLGQATLNLLYHIFSMSNTKNTSLIMLGFKNIQLCLKKNDKLNLPYMQEQLKPQKIDN